jgi:hypothetical protein
MKPHHVISGLLLSLAAATVGAQSPVLSCDAAGIGAIVLDAEGAPASIIEVTAENTGTVPFCLVKLRVPEAINIWVGLPMDGQWNGRWQSMGGGGYAGSVNVPTPALNGGYAAATTDTGHTVQDGGRFGMGEPGVPNGPLQQDFAYRSEHLMVVLGKQLVEAFYGQQPVFSYWNGCSTGGRQGLRMAQDYPDDYDGVLAGAPAIHWDRFQATFLWHSMVIRQENNGPIGGGDRDVLAAKQLLATQKAIAACDAIDGITDGIINDPRQCEYSAAADASLTLSDCTAGNAACLTPAEASAIDLMWQGPVACADGSADCDVPDNANRNLAQRNIRLWYGQARGTPLTALGGATPFFIGTEQPKYWVYFDPDWNWQTLDYGNYPQFFADTVDKVGPMMASDNPDLTAFRDKGGKLMLYHGWSDPLIMPEGTIDYYNRVNQAMGNGDYSRTREFARLFMAPGVGHCAGGDGPQPQNWFESLVNWVENDTAPETVLAVKQLDNGATRSRPLCPHPARAEWTGQGSTDDAANFACVVPE